MKKIYFLMLTIVLLSGFKSIGQTNPTAQSLPYTQDFSSLSHASTTYPAGWQGWQFSTSPGASFNTTTPTGDRALIASSTAATTSGNVHNYNGKIGFLNTASLDLSLVVSINASGQKAIKVTYDIMTIRNPYDGASNTRINEVTLQYRIGTSGNFTDLTGIEYQNNTTLQTTAVTNPQNSQTKTITLPSTCDNQSEIQLRWASRQVSGAGSRPSFAIDNVNIISSVDGVITAGEYGTHTNGQNQQTNGATWLMTWDNNNLYLGWSGLANSGNGNNRRILMYFDVNPTVPVNGGTNSDGNLTGFSYSNSQLGTLPFRADCFLSLETGYRQLNTADGSGGWSAANTSYGVRAFGSSNDVAELAIPWSTITGGGLPTSFNFAGYVTDGNGGGNYFYQMPLENPSGLIGTSIPNGGANGFERYYTVSTTTVGSSTPPFSQNSYVFNRNSDANGFGAISVFDFTMNTSGRNISRTGATSSNWTIANNMVLGNGIVYMGSGGTNGSYGTTTISGNLDIRGGELNLDQTTSPVIVNGNVSLSSGNLVLSGNGFGGGDLKVRGNWNYTGGTFTPNSRAVFFDGTSGDQTVTGTTTFDLLLLDKSAGNLVLASPISLNQTLTLTNGKVVLGANDLSLLNAAPSSLSAGSAASYVVTDGAGAFRRAIGTVYNGQDYFFPVGTAANRQLATINFNTISANNTLAARFLTGSTSNLGLNPPLTESGHEISRVAFNGRWEINAASATTDLYTGTYIANNFTDITDFSKVHLVKRADGSSPWVLNGVHVATTGSNSLAILQRTGMSGFSQFGVGGASNFSLPVTFLNFSGYKDGSRNQLSWTTATEINNRGFEVQRSTDGVNYIAIGFVNSLAAGGNSNDKLSYRFTDNTPAGVKQYYRLRQEDFDGRNKLSTIVLINGSKPTGVMINGLFPNPANDILNVLVAVPGRTPLTVLVTDMAGRTLSQKVVSAETGSNTIQLNVGSLSSGTYLIRLVCEDGCQPAPAKFVKQ